MIWTADTPGQGLALGQASSHEYISWRGEERAREAVEGRKGGLESRWRARGEGEREGGGKASGSPGQHIP